MAPAAAASRPLKQEWEGGQLSSLYFRLQSKNIVASHSGGKDTLVQPGQVVFSLPHISALKRHVGVHLYLHLLISPWDHLGPGKSKCRAGDRLGGCGGGPGPRWGAWAWHPEPSLCCPLALGQ